MSSAVNDYALFGAEIRVLGEGGEPEVLRISLPAANREEAHRTAERINRAFRALNRLETLLVHVRLAHEDLEKLYEDVQARKWES